MQKDISTKDQIFNVALRLFATTGVENASMRDIAENVGIKTASIYNHFESKGQILEECYRFFENYRDELRLSQEQYLPILQHGTKQEVVSAPNYDFPRDKIENGIYSLMVTFSNVYIDARAREIYLALKREAMAYLKEFFETGIEIDRFLPFDHQPVSSLYLSVKLNAAHMVSVDPGGDDHLYEYQANMFHLFEHLIPFRY